MAAQKPSFITGASAKIQVGGRTLAYASEVSYAVAVDTIPVETMGRYEAVTNEPISYSVGGELSIVRYTALAKNISKTSAAQKGNGIGEIKPSAGGDVSQHMDPSSLLLSQTYDIVVFQKAAGASAAAPVTEKLITITDARFNRLSGGLTKRGLLVERLAFVGVLLNQDSFTAHESGDTDLS